MHKYLLTYNALYVSIEFLHYFCTSFIRAGCRILYVIHWSSGREGHNNYRRDLVIWLDHLIYSEVGFALCYNYVILNYCIRFAVLPCVRLFLNSCLLVSSRILYEVVRTGKYAWRCVCADNRWWHLYDRTVTNY